MRLVSGLGCCASLSFLTYFDAGALLRLILVVPACRRVSSSSRRLFFQTAHIFIIAVVTSVSSGRRIALSRPSLLFHHLDEHASSLLSSLPPEKRRRQPPSSVVCGKHRCRSLRASPSSMPTSSTIPPPRMRTRRTKDGHRWSANRRRQNQRCQLRAWNR
jgi:hypothetical protein